MLNKFEESGTISGKNKVKHKQKRSGKSSESQKEVRAKSKRGTISGENKVKQKQTTPDEVEQSKNGHRLNQKSENGHLSTQKVENVKNPKSQKVKKSKLFSLN